MMEMEQYEKNTADCAHLNVNNFVWRTMSIIATNVFEVGSGQHFPKYLLQEITSVVFKMLHGRYSSCDTFGGLDKKFIREYINCQCFAFLFKTGQHHIAYKPFTNKPKETTPPPSSD